MQWQKYNLIDIFKNVLLDIELCLHIYSLIFMQNCINFFAIAS